MPANTPPGIGFARYDSCGEAIENVMKWKNVHRDLLPADGQEVLLAVNGVYYQTQYSATDKIFLLKGEPETSFGISDKATMHWVEIGDPPTAKNLQINPSISPNQDLI